MRMCEVMQDRGIIPPYGQCYSVEVLDSGKHLFATENGLADLDLSEYVGEEVQ